LACSYFCRASLLLFAFVALLGTQSVKIVCAFVNGILSAVGLRTQRYEKGVKVCLKVFAINWINFHKP